MRRPSCRPSATFSGSRPEARRSTLPPDCALGARWGWRGKSTDFQMLMAELLSAPEAAVRQAAAEAVAHRGEPAGFGQ